MDDPLKNFPVVIELPVLWGEMDAFAHVNNTVYFRWFESVRIAYFEKVDFAATRDGSSLGPILASTRCRFRIPLTYPDMVSIGARVTEIQSDRFMMEYVVVSRAHQAIAAEGDGVVVAFDYRQNKKAALPPEIKKRIEELEASAKSTS
jgi:acyl-CoA thioester hydrolase